MRQLRGRDPRVEVAEFARRRAVTDIGGLRREIQKEDRFPTHYSCMKERFGFYPYRPPSSARYLTFCVFILLFVASALHSSQVLAESNRQNWFHDPFFQISDAVANCPMPIGPFVTEDQRLTDAHHRAERGTTCWLVGKCDRPNSYAYDQDIASAFKDELRRHNPFTASTLWVTVQGRVVYIEGCAVEKGMAGQIEAFARAIPYVEVAVAKVHSDPASDPPYPVLPRK